MLARGSRLTKKRELCCGLFLRNFQLPFRGAMATVALVGLGKAQFAFTSYCDRPQGGDV
jgi:hypothetical protein